MVLLTLVGCSPSDKPSAPVAQPEPRSEANSTPPPQQPAPAPAPLPAVPEPTKYRFPDREELANLVVYLDPGDYPELPLEVRQALEDRKCRIPQLYSSSSPIQDPWVAPRNLVSGHFKSLNEVHWAALCSQAGKSSLLVFDSLGQLTDTLGGPSEDSDWMQDLGEGEGLVYSWDIGEATPEHIREDEASFGDGSVSVPILLEGIEDSFVDKGSSIWYWHDCQWIELTGFD